MHEQLEKEAFARRLRAGENLKIVSLEVGERLTAAFALLLLLPILLFCAFLIRFGSPGAILFRQNRVGRNGEIFTLYKFRTMREATSGLPFTAEGDRRITRVGKFLRKRKLDELPQLYNVFRGEMNFVGPRPELSELIDFNRAEWQKVLSVRPGITDPVTLRFRNEETLLAAVEDKRAFYSEVIQPYKLNGYLLYLEKKSVKNDLKIIALTLKAIIFPQTAPPITIDEVRSASFPIEHIFLKE
jgi:lipopolysaccharide/colanic/teichoic acid biosynthesis glycosyltransferase